MFNIRSLQTFGTLDIKNMLFDGLHGVINVGKLLVTLLKDVQSHNSELVVIPLVDVLVIYPELRDLDVPGKRASLHINSQCNSYTIL